MSLKAALQALGILLAQVADLVSSMSPGNERRCASSEPLEC
jgi:hypothetical protein